VTVRQIERVCDEDGCTNVGLECSLPDDDTVASYAYCDEHIFNNGFCRMCGQFWGGVESFEFLNGGYCDNCRSELDHEDAEPDDDEWDDLDVVP